MENEIIEEQQLHQLGTPTVGKKHDWRQMGGELVCMSCESQHGIHIGINKKFKGYSEKGDLIIE